MVRSGEVAAVAARAGPRLLRQSVRCGLPKATGPREWLSAGQDVAFCNKPYHGSACGGYHLWLAASNQSQDSRGGADWPGAIGPILANGARQTLHFTLIQSNVESTPPHAKGIVPDVHHLISSRSLER